VAWPEFEFRRHQPDATQEEKKRHLAGGEGPLPLLPFLLQDPE
jgi:hypothetical protein